MNQRAQVAPFMVVIVVVLILAIAATVLIGEAGFQRIRLANIADSAVISQASELCRSLNMIRKFHNTMFLNYLSLQTQLLVAPIILFGMPAWPNKGVAYAYSWSVSLIGIESNRELFNQAEETAENAAKNLRAGLYESTFGGALVDEPKPFIDIPFGDPTASYDPSSDACDPDILVGWDEVGRDPEPNGKVSLLNYEKYLFRGSPFNCQYRDFKKSNSSWYNAASISYAFNKTKDKVLSNPGQLSVGEPLAGYEAFLKVQLNDAPSQVSVRPQIMILFFFSCQPCKVECCFWPGFVVNPWAWIRKVDMDSDSFGVTLTKRIPFTRIPFFGREVDLTHRSRTRIRGSIWSGYDFQLEE